MQTSDKQKTMEKGMVVDGARIYETVYVSNLGSIGYYWLDRISEERGFVASAKVGDTTYFPPRNNLATNGMMLFPMKVEKYGSFLDLLENVRSFIHKYLELPEDYELVASCYVILSWVHDCFDTIPYLRARGDYGTGKTRFLRVIGSICYRPLFASGASTTSPIFRLIDIYKGLTLVIDEADFRFSGPDAEMIKILNTGYMKGMGVLRTEGDRVKTPTSFCTFGPKIIATRKEFEDQALESRCLTHYMTGVTRTDIPLVIPKIFEYEAEVIRNQLLLFRMEHLKEYEIDPSLAVRGVEPRVNQVLMPLFALVDSEEVREKLVEFARKHANTQAESRSSTIEADVFLVLMDLARAGSAISLKRASEKINENRSSSNGEYLVSPTKIGRINKTNFGFQTRKVNGVTEILWNRDNAQRLCVRYNIEPMVDDVAFVDLFNPLVNPSPDNVLSPSVNAPDTQNGSTSSTNSISTEEGL